MNTIAAKTDKDDYPQIVVSNIRLCKHRTLKNQAAAFVDIEITGVSGLTRRRENARLVFEGYFPISIPVARYSLYVPGEDRHSYTRGTRPIPPCWRIAARWAVYDACCAAEEVEKKREAAEIAAGTRWPPLPATYQERRASA